MPKTPHGDRGTGEKGADSGCRRVCLKAYYGQPPTSNRTCTDCNTATQ